MPSRRHFRRQEWRQEWFSIQENNRSRESSLQLNFPNQGMMPPAEGACVLVDGIELRLGVRLSRFSQTFSEVFQTACNHDDLFVDQKFGQAIDE